MILLQKTDTNGLENKMLVCCQRLKYVLDFWINYSLKLSYFSLLVELKLVAQLFI